MITEMRRRAIARALERGGAAAVVRVRYGLYRVASSSRPGVWHTVAVDARGAGAPVYRCDCEAGLAGRACWHAGAVYVAKVEHGRGPGGGPAAPARTPAPAAAVIDLRHWRAA